MTQLQIPLETGAQIFSIVLGDVQYQMTLIYREADGGGWYLDILRVEDRAAIRGLPLIIGPDLLAQHKYKGFGSLRCSLAGGEERELSYEDVGSTLSLVWSDD